MSRELGERDPRFKMNRRGGTRGQSMPPGKVIQRPLEAGKTLSPHLTQITGNYELELRKVNRKTLASGDRQYHFLSYNLTDLSWSQHKMKLTHLPFKVVARIKIINIQINTYMLKDLRKYLPKMLTVIIFG